MVGTEPGSSGRKAVLLTAEPYLQPLSFLLQLNIIFVFGCRWPFSLHNMLAVGNNVAVNLVVQMYH